MLKFIDSACYVWHSGVMMVNNKRLGGDWGAATF